MRVAGIRTICGTAEPNDQYIINFLGQKIVTSKRDMFELEKRADSSGTQMILIFTWLFNKESGLSDVPKNFIPEAQWSGIRASIAIVKILHIRSFFRFRIA